MSLYISYPEKCLCEQTQWIHCSYCRANLIMGCGGSSLYCTIVLHNWQFNVVRYRTSFKLSVVKYFQVRCATTVQYLLGQFIAMQDRWKCLILNTPWSLRTSAELRNSCLNHTKFPFLNIMSNNYIIKWKLNKKYWKLVSYVKSLRRSNTTHILITSQLFADFNSSSSLLMRNFFNWLVKAVIAATFGPKF